MDVEYVEFVRRRSSAKSGLEAFQNGPLSLNTKRAMRARNVLFSDMRELGAAAKEPKARSEAVTSFLLKSSDVLFDYQTEVLEKLGLYGETNFRRAMVALPTGGGKTRTALWFCRERICSNSASRILWLAPTIELVNQAVNTLKQLWNLRDSPPVGVRLHNVDDFLRPKFAQAMFCFVTTQLATARLQQIKRYRPDVVIIDEAHQAAARSIRDLVTSLIDAEYLTLIGLSATPGRSSESEGELLADIFGRNLVVPELLMPDPISELRERGVLSRIHRREIVLPNQWAHARVKDFSARGISDRELALIPARFWAVVDSIEAIAKDRQCIVFCCSIAHCEALAAGLQYSGISRRVLSTRTPASDRAEIVSDFQNGRIRVLLNKSILAAGFDLPKLSDVVLATPIRSAILWEQIVGRVSRGPKVGGSPDANIWEIDDHFSMHGDVLSARRYAGDIW